MSLGKWFLKTFEDTDVDTLQSTIKHLQDEINGLEEKLGAYRDKCKTLTATSTDQADSIKSLQAEIVKLKSDIRYKDERLDKINGSLP